MVIEAMESPKPARIALRRLGRSAVELSALGFGAAAIGNLYRSTSDEQAELTVRAALEAGIRYFDTAPHYGFGLSEIRLGRALHGAGDAVVVSTKVGRVLRPAPGADLAQPRQGFVSPEPFESAFDYSYEGAQRALAASLKRLRRERIDVVLAHDIGRATHGEEHARRWTEFLDGACRAMHEWREQGLVGAIGLGVNEWEICAEALRHADFDCFLLAGRYTLLEQSALDRLLPDCAARGVSLIVGGPYNSGILASGVRGDTAHYNYAAAPAAIVERVGRIEDICRAHGVPLAAAALQFPLAHPQVCSVIPGAASPEEVRQSLALLRTPIPAVLWTDLRQNGLLHAQAPVPPDAGFRIPFTESSPGTDRSK